MDNHQKDLEGTGVAAEEMEREEPKSELELEGFELDLLAKDSAEFRTPDSLKSFESTFGKPGDADSDVLEIAKNRGELTEDEKLVVRSEITRRTLAQIGPELDVFVNQVTSKGGETADMIKKAMEKGTPEILALLVMQFAVNEELGKTGDEVELVEGQKIHDLHVKMKGSEVKGTDSVGKKAAAVAMKMFDRFGGFQMDDSVRHASPDRLFRKAAGLK